MTSHCPTYKTLYTTRVCMQHIEYSLHFENIQQRINLSVRIFYLYEACNEIYLISFVIESEETMSKYKTILTHYYCYILRHLIAYLAMLNNQRDREHVRYKSIL